MSTGVAKRRARKKPVWIAERQARLRESASPAERCLLDAMRARGFEHDGELLGRYFGDFVHRRCRLVVEVDGGYHEAPAQRARDRARTRDLNHHGWRVERFTNAQAMLHREWVLRRVDDLLWERGLRPPQPAVVVEAPPRAEVEVVRVAAPKLPDPCSHEEAARRAAWRRSRRRS